MIKPERLAKLLEERGIAQAELARRVGVTSTAINHLLKRGTGGSKHIHQIARELHTSPEYLTGETNNPDGISALGDQRLAFRGKQDDRSSAGLQIREVDIAYGMGGTFIDDNDVNTRMMAIDQKRLRTYTRAPPDKVFVARGIGDSMMPTLLDSDTILVDQSQNTMRANELIWAVSYGDFGMIKRLRSMPDGSILVISDNPAIADFTASDDELHIIGRVVAFERKL